LNECLACIERLIPRQGGAVSEGDALHRDIDQFADDHGDHQQPRCLGVQMQFAEARRQELAETDRQQHEHQDEREERE
jgi:hypothetical protein